MEIVSILRASYSLEKNSDSGGGVKIKHRHTQDLCML